MIKLKNILEFVNDRGIEVSSIKDDHERMIFDDFLKMHYIGKGASGITEKYLIRYQYKIIGIIGYGIPTSPLLTKQLNLSSGELLELRRLYIIDDTDLHNAESQVISLGNKELKENKPNVKVIVTYADPSQGHQGTIYQATNAKYLGKGAGKTGKHKYIYILGNRSEKKQTIKTIKAEPQEYPVGVGID